MTVHDCAILKPCHHHDEQYYCRDGECVCIKDNYLSENVLTLLKLTNK